MGLWDKHGNLTCSPVHQHTGRVSSVFIRALDLCLSKNGFSLVEILVVLSLMALLVFFLGSKINNIGKENRVYKTCHTMEEIKEAIIGRQGLYCNGIRQFTGYVSDMGVLPGLFDEEENRVDYNNNIGDNKLEEILKGKLIVQPKGLWTRHIGEHEIPEWEYYGDANIWAGWRGPYISPPPDDVLRDRWGNTFIFIIGELITYNEEKTYRCIETHDCTADEPHEPGDDEIYWEELKESNDSPIYINANLWINPNYWSGSDRITPIDIFYDDALQIISYGKDGLPGGKGLDKDLVLTIYPEEYTGEVAGHVGYTGRKYVDKVTLYYPKEGKIENAPIEIEDNDYEFDMEGEMIDCGINFRFGTAPMSTGICLRWEQQCREYDDSNNCIEYVDVCVEPELLDRPRPDSNWEKVAVPIGIRSIKAGGGDYIFPVEAAGNWIGTLK